MSKTWVIADPHFGHEGVCKFTRSDKVTPLRPWDSAEEMDKVLVENWNNVVGEKDRIYVLGDVVMRKKHLATLKLLNGRKVLVKGNHDIEKIQQYLPIFDDVRAYVVKKGFIMSHIPIHTQSMGRWQFNIHGHLHSNIVRNEKGEPDPRYICVSVEQINYTPLNLQVILDKLVF